MKGVKSWRSILEPRAKEKWQEKRKIAIRDGWYRLPHCHSLDFPLFTFFFLFKYRSLCWICFQTVFQSENSLEEINHHSTKVQYFFFFWRTLGRVKKARHQRFPLSHHSYPFAQNCYFNQFFFFGACRIMRRGYSRRRCRRRSDTLAILMRLNWWM